MGWTGIKGNYLPSEFIQQAADSFINVELMQGAYESLRNELTKEDDKFVIYSAVKHPEGHVFGLVTLVDIQEDKELFFKEMDETMGPVYYGASKKLIDMLDETDYEYAKEWRVKCLK